MRSTCILLTAAFLLAPTTASASDDFAADAAFLGEIDTSRAPPTTTRKASELGVDGQLAFARELSRKGLPEAALAFLRHAAREHPERADVWYQLATTLEAAKREREAAEAFDRYLALAPSGQASPSQDLRRRASLDWSPTPARYQEPAPTRRRPTAIIVPEPAAPVATSSAPSPTPARSRATPRRERPARKPARAEGPPPSQRQINGMLEILGER